MKQHTAYYKSDIGTVEIVGTSEHLISISFIEKDNLCYETPSSLAHYVQAIDEYFHGRRKNFSLPILWDGTEFQKKVWQTLMEITFGTTASYKDIAARLGNDKSFRAVGNAAGKNKISIIIPCHRLIKSDGDIGNYGGGVWRKKWLLEHERKCSTS
jgi:methylated-DNA-[protein]-cysteine S-methyltransferase